MGIKINLILVAIAITYTIFPRVIGFLGMGLASRFGCEFRGALTVCPDQAFLGELLTNMIAFHGLGLVTIPSGAIVSAILLIILILQLIKESF